MKTGWPIRRVKTGPFKKLKPHASSPFQRTITALGLAILFHLFCMGIAKNLPIPDMDCSAERGYPFGTTTTSTSFFLSAFSISAGTGLSVTITSAASNPHSFEMLCRPNFDESMQKITLRAA